MTLRKLLLIVLTLACPAGARAADEIEFRRDVVYGNVGELQLKLDLAAPKNLRAAAPALVAIHGGGWAAGRKEDFGDIIRAAAGRGYVAVSVGYRLAPQHPFPAQIEDCKCAVRWLRAHAAELKLDPRRVAAVGGSAGAHLAMLLGTMDPADGLEGDGGWTEQPSKVQAVVSYVGPTNLIGDFPPSSQQILKNFLGGPEDQKRDLYRRASPVNYVDAQDAPMLLFQGTKDQLVPHDQAVQMAEALTRAGVAGRVEILLGEGHGFRPAEMQRTLSVMYEFLDQRLKPTAAPPQAKP